MLIVCNSNAGCYQFLNIIKISISVSIYLLYSIPRNVVALVNIYMYNIYMS